MPPAANQFKPAPHVPHRPGIGVLLLVWVLWPFYSVPTGCGVITQFGKIVGIEGGTGRPSAGRS